MYPVIVSYCVPEDEAYNKGYTKVRIKFKYFVERFFYILNYRKYNNILRRSYPDTVELMDECSFLIRIPYENFEEEFGKLIDDLTCYSKDYQFIFTKEVF